MSNAKRDQNSVPTLLGTLNTDGKTIVLAVVNPVNNGIQINDGTTGSDFGPINTLRDENDIPALMAVSSVDGVTPVAVYFDSTGKILTQST